MSRLIGIIALLIEQSLFGQHAFDKLVRPHQYDALPIKPARTISFDTEEGSYMDITLSPDGSTILFTLIGDIYSVPAKGGEAKQITKGLAVNRCPVWSPDGNYIAYISDATGFNRLHILSVCDSFHAIYGEDTDQMENEDVTAPIWSADSKWVSYDDRLYGLSGSTYFLPNNVEQLFGFSKDNTTMYYGCGFARQGSLKALRHGTNGKTVVRQYNNVSGIDTFLFGFDKSPEKIWNPKISPDGRWFTYLNYDQSYGRVDSLMIVDLKSGKERLLQHLDINFSGWVHRQGYSFSEDSKAVIFGYGGKIHRISIETGKNDVIPFKAQVNIDLGSFNYNTFDVSLDSLDVAYTRFAQCSPDGRHLVFSAVNKIYVKDLSRNNLKLLANQQVNQFQPSYSNDGKWITYVTWGDAEGGHVWCVSATGGKPKKITKEAGLYLNPSWSPDNRFIVVARGEPVMGRRDGPPGNGIGDIRVISINTEEVKIIDSNVTLWNRPTFSTDGNRVLYCSFGDGRYVDNNDVAYATIVSQSIKGKKLNSIVAALHLVEYAEVWPIRQLLLSPDEKYLVVMSKENLYVVPIFKRDSSLTFDAIGKRVPLIRFARGGVDPHWENSGKILSWSFASKYYQIDPKKLFDAAAKLEPGRPLSGLPATNIIDVDIAADKTVDLGFKVSRYYGKGFVAFTNVRLITMHADKVIENGTVVIGNGRILAAGEVKGVKPPSGCKIFDLTGKTIMPGLIDMHSHMYEAVPPDVFIQQSWQRLANLIMGITTVRDPSGSFDTFGYSELIESGQMAGPRLFSVGRAVRSDIVKLNNKIEVDVVVSNLAKQKATSVKQYDQPTRLQKQLLLSSSKERGLNMTNETELHPLYCLAMIKDGSTGIEHNSSWGDAYSDVVKTIALSQTFLTPTLQTEVVLPRGSKNYFRKVFDPNCSALKSDQYLPLTEKRDIINQISEQSKLDTEFLIQARLNASMVRAGGHIVAGSHGEDQGTGQHYEIWALQMGGLTNMEALKTSTITAAEALGMQHDLGSIEEGKIADLIILDKNPLEDIHNTTSIKYVMKSGVLYSGENLDQVWPKKRKAPTVWR